MHSVDYESALNETRTNAEQSETEADLRISFESDDLYFIRVKDGPVKIGRTSLDPLRRMALLQVGCPYELILLGTAAGEGDAESLIHAHFGRYRMRGEWFEWSDEVATFVGDILTGKDWRSIIGPSWWAGSPLYAGDPKYPQYQL